MKIKAHLNSLKRWYKKYFVGKTIIHAYGFKPAELHRRFMRKNKKMVSLYFTNLKGNQTNCPFTVVPFTDVYMMRRMPCLFVKNLYALVGDRPKGITYKIKHK